MSIETKRYGCITKLYDKGKNKIKILGICYDL